MNYLTHYYKNLSEQLQNEVDLLQKQLNEVMSTEVDSQQQDISAGKWKWLDDLINTPRTPDIPHRVPQKPSKIIPDNWGGKKNPGQKTPDGPPSGLDPNKGREVPKERQGHPINPLGGGVYEWAGQYWFLSTDGIVYRWSSTAGGWVPISPNSNNPFGVVSP